MLVGNKSDEESGKREVAANTGSALEVRWQHPLIFSEYSNALINLFSCNSMLLIRIMLYITENVEMQIH